MLLPRIAVGRGVLTAVATVMVACANASTFSPVAAGAPGAYAEQRFAPDHYLITLGVSRSTPHDQIETDLLYRAARLTIASGYDSFLIVRERMPSWQSAVPGYGYTYWQPGMGGGWYTVPEPRYGQPTQATAEVILKTGLPARGEPGVYDAQRLIKDSGAAPPTLPR